MAASAMTRLLLLSSLVATVHAHGSTSAPKPRNAEPASKGFIAYGVTFSANASTVSFANASDTVSLPRITNASVTAPGSATPSEPSRPPPRARAEP